MSSKSLLSAFFLILAICTVPAGAASLNDDLRSKYEGKVMMLRNFYCGSGLTFDEQGVLQSGGAPGAWTLCRDIRIGDIKIDGNLKIRGQRIYLAHSRDHDEFLDVTLQEPEANKKTKAWEDLLRSQQVLIEVQLPPNADRARVQLAMDKLFYASEQEFIETVPQVWKGFFAAAPAPISRRIESGVSEPTVVVKAEKVGGKVQAPRCTYQPDPPYTDEARLAKYRGTTTLTVVVDATGQVPWIRVSRPLGMGLDEQAAATISTWKFDPALRDGTPVAVQINIEVTFNLY